MKAAISVEPAVEPVTLAEVKSHLRIDSGELDDLITTYQSIIQASHAIGAVTGTGVSVSGMGVIVNLNAGTVTATCTVDAKIQESDDNIAFTDWTGGAFTQITPANDNAVQEIQYTGIKEYVRVLATVANDAGIFSAEVITQGATFEDDTLLTNMVKAARTTVEDIIWRKLITQTWILYLDSFPAGDIELPFGSLQSVTSIKYTDTDDDESTVDAATYSLDTVSIRGRIVLDFGETWPTDTLRTMNPIAVTFICGYGLAADVPEAVKDGLKMLVGDMYEHRETTIVGQGFSQVTLDLADILLRPYRIY